MGNSNRTASPPRSIKIAVLGDQQVGKTSLVMRLTKNLHVSEYRATPTIQTWEIPIVEFTNPQGKQKFNVQLIDLMGIIKQWFGQQDQLSVADACILMFSLDDSKSFSRLDQWYNTMCASNRHGISTDFRFPFVLIGNKSDLPQESQKVSFDDADKWARNHNMPYYEASTKSGANVEMALAVAIHRLWDFENDYHTDDPHKVCSVRIPRREETKGAAAGDGGCCPDCCSCWLWCCGGRKGLCCCCCCCCEDDEDRYTLIQ